VLPALPTDERPTLTHTEHDPNTPAAVPAAALLPPGLRPRVDLPAVASRYRVLTVTATTTGTATGPEDVRRAALASAADVPRLVSELDRLCRALVRSRLRYANLAAAAHATLTATHDGDPDPAEYLRDELTHPTPTEPPPARAHRVDLTSGRRAGDLGRR